MAWLPREVPAMPESDARAAWPFGDAPRAIEGYLRSIDDRRTALIRDLGNGQRLYPTHDGNYLHFDALEGLCSDPNHQKPGSGACVDAWEDRFRFGTDAGISYRLPLANILISEAKGGSRLIVRRRARPNVVRNGVTSQTHVKRARERSPERIPELIHDLIESIRADDLYNTPEAARPVGHPPADRYGIAAASIARANGAFCFQEMTSRNRDLHERNLLPTLFHYNRMSDALGKEWLTSILEVAYFKARRVFRKSGSIFVADGTVLSTARSDNARRGSISRSGPVQVLAHMMYEHRWGVPTAFRLTWFQRGAGSAESPQLPYLMRETKRTGFRPDYFLADRAFSSEDNFHVALQLRAVLLSPLKMNSTANGREVKWNSDTKQKLGYDEARRIAADCNPDNPSPLFAYLMPYRQASESWHAAQKNSILWYIASRPDRSSMPIQMSKAIKENPETHYLGLPKSEVDREAVIREKQFVGQRVYNEYLCRMIAMCLRATNRAELWYRETADYSLDFAFSPVPEDEKMGPYRRAA